MHTPFPADTMKPMEPLITKRVDNEGAVYFTVRWSPLAEVDRYEIIKKVPAMSGLFELYFQDKRKKLNRFYIARVWIGSLRSRIRKLTDPTLVEEENWKEVLNTKKCFYRYSVTNSFNDLTDVFYFFAETFYPGRHKTYHSDRYENIFVEELSPDKIVTI